jgi:hypothetical protein
VWLSQLESMLDGAAGRFLGEQLLIEVACLIEK